MIRVLVAETRGYEIISHLLDSVDLQGDLQDSQPNMVELLLHSIAGNDSQTKVDLPMLEVPE